MRRGEVRLGWNFQVETTDRQHHYDLVVDATDGLVWTRFDWVASDNYRVYSQPNESPNHATPVPPADGRTLVVDPANGTASPFGWHDTNGVAGAEFNTTHGNNVQAYTDVDANNTPDTGSSPSGGTVAHLRLRDDRSPGPQRLSSGRGDEPLLLEQHHPRRPVPVRVRRGRAATSR